MKADKSPKLREDSRMSIIRPRYQTSNPNSAEALEEVIREEVKEDEEKKGLQSKTKLLEAKKDIPPKTDGGLFSRFFSLCC